MFHVLDDREILRCRSKLDRLVLVVIVLFLSLRKDLIQLLLLLYGLIVVFKVSDLERAVSYTWRHRIRIANCAFSKIVLVLALVPRWLQAHRLFHLTVDVDVKLLLEVLACG